MTRVRSLVLLLAFAMLAGCAAPAPSARQPAGGYGAPARAEPQRTFVAIVRLEPASIALRPPREAFAATTLQNRLFNADLAIVDDEAVPRPYLAEALPQLNTDSWRVFPDGKMETTYRLRPNLVWHDGQPLTAEDFVFGWRLYTGSDIGFGRQPPFDSIEEVQAPDPRTLRIRWSKAYPDAGHMSGRDRNLPALPRHLLEAQFASETIDNFLALPFWTRDYVGSGPFRMVRWEPGSFIEGVAFDQHATGRPKIERLQLRFVGDSNTALANMLAGEAHLAGDSVATIEQGLTLRREWEPRQGGLVHFALIVWRGADFQFRNGFTSPQSLTDVRVRRAMSHGVDKETVNEVVNSGAAPNAIWLLPAEGAWGKAVERGAVRYPYDPRRAEELMREAGYEKGADGVYTSPTQGRFTVEVRVTASRESENELAALADNWRQNGFEINQSIVPNALAQDLEIRAGYPGLYIQSVPANDRFPVAFTPDAIPLPENRWRGSNRSGWTNPEYTRLIGEFMSTLDQSQREEQLARMARIFTEDAAAIPMSFRPIVWAYSSSIKGPKPVPPETSPAWDIHTWEFH